MTDSGDIQALVTRVRRRDRQAFDALVEPLRERLVNQVRSRMGARVGARLEVDDIVQEALLTAYKSIERLEWRGEEAFYRWLASIAEHLLWRAARDAGPIPLELDEEIDGGDSSVSRLLSREERRERLESALADLSPEHREVIVLTRLEGLRVADVAARLGHSENAVRKLLGRYEQGFY